MNSGESSRTATAVTTAAIVALLFGATACASSKSKTSKPKASLTSGAPSVTPSATATPSTARTGPAASKTAAAPAKPATSPGTPPAPPATALVTVAPVPVVTQRAVTPQSSGNFGGGVTVKITKIASVKSAGSGPGEIAGAPSVALTITLANGTASTVSLESVAVTAAYGSALTPASPSDGPPSGPFTGSVAARRSASGTYVFQIPVDQRGNVTVSMSYTASKPTVVFHGSVAN